MALKGIRVLQFSGSVPAAFCGMILADFGADVIQIDKINSASVITDTLCRGKKSIAVDLESQAGASLVKEMSQKVDVLVEPFHRGEMEKFGLGPQSLMRENPGLVYARLTGFGQDGPLAGRAGHDINYLAISGLLSVFRFAGHEPYAPINLIAELSGGGLMCALGVCMALLSRYRSGQGQVIDASMVEGAAYVGSFLWSARQLGVLGKIPGSGRLEGGAPWYNIYTTKDGLFMSVGANESKFYEILIKALGLSLEDHPQTHDPRERAKLYEKFTEIFKIKSQQEWIDIFERTDACCMPVIALDQAPHYAHNVARKSFIADNNGKLTPRPAPRLSRTPGVAPPGHPHMMTAGVAPPGEGNPPGESNPHTGQHTVLTLKRLGFTEDNIRMLIESGIVYQSKL